MEELVEKEELEVELDEVDGLTLDELVETLEDELLDEVVFPLQDARREGNKSKLNNKYLFFI